MKKKLFLFVIVAAVGAAFFTRPRDPKASFTQYLVDHKSTGVVPAEWTDAVSRTFADSCEYKDHYLWVDVKFDGKTIYTDAYSHWFSRAEIKKDFQNGVVVVKDKIDRAADKLAGKSS